MSRLDEHLRFFYHQRIRGFQPPRAPHLDHEGGKYFGERLVKCRSYLEYGSGGSTVAAAQLDKDFTTVDTDRFYLDVVKKRIIDDIGSVRGRLIWADIGFVGQWGAPVFTGRLGQKQKWRRYAETPWLLSDPNWIPDFVLIDGRFRVAAALTSILHLYNRIDFEIAIDDYDRPNFHVVEEFAQLEARHGGVGVFRPKKIDVDRLKRTIEDYLLDFR